MRTRTIIRSFLTTVVIIGTSAALAKDKASDSFLKKAIEGNYAEVKMGELAQNNGQSDGVKSSERPSPVIIPPPTKRRLARRRLWEWHLQPSQIPSKRLTTTRWRR